MAVASDLPQLEDRAQFANAQNSVVYDVNGQKIATLTNNEGRILINSGDIAPVMKEATVSIEDQRFYEHRGVDFQGIGRAVVQDILHTGASQGASTITEQFVKNALRAQGSRTVFEKLREAALAYQLERHWDKDKILTEYLNEIYFGEGAYGIEEAAKTYFGWNHPGCGQDGNPACASDLLPWEAAMLAGVIANPSAYDPRINPKDAAARRNVVLQNMADQGYITQDEYAQYARQPVPKPSQIQTPSEDSKAPYFTSWLRQQLVDKYGAGEAFGGGLKVTSTLEPPPSERGAADRGWADARRRPELGGRGAEQRHRRCRGDGRRHRLFQAALQPRDAGPSPARARRSSRSPWSPRSSRDIPPTRRSRRRHRRSPSRRRSDKKGKRKGRAGGLPGPQLRGRVPRAARRSPPRPPTPTTRCTPSSGCRAGRPRQRGSDREQDGNPDEPRHHRHVKYSVGGGPFAPYNPALILGGLRTGVSPLEMAHAYQTLAHNGQIVSGTMADSSDGADRDPEGPGPGRQPGRDEQRRSRPGQG